MTAEASASAMPGAKADGREAWLGRFQSVRAETLRLAQPLSAEDQQIQSMPDVSPTKWHLAHVTWFFETFLLEPNLAGYRPFDPVFGYLFNSYYEAVGERHPRPQRGLLSRPSLEHVRAYRAHVDEAMGRLILGADAAGWSALQPLVELGLNHEQQHQELILMDIKHVFWTNPLHPAYVPTPALEPAAAPALEWLDFDGGLVEIGHEGQGFAFDNEGPRHKAWVEPYRLASRLASCGEYLRFIEDGGYSRPELWLSDGWAAVAHEGWTAPLYWSRADAGGWQVFTLSGPRPLDPAEPVCHLSYYEADAFARWSGARLPTEAEWEAAAPAACGVGELSDGRRYHPGPAPGGGLQQMIGDLWEWTMSPYVAYPRYRPPEGAVGEYNGKFMSGQMVLRGGAAVTPADHIRATYRNFFPPGARWAFSGVNSPPMLDIIPGDTALIAFHDHAAEEESFLDAALEGLSRPDKAIPCRFLYDIRGSALFDEICELPEYYPTRTETGILKACAAQVARRIGPAAQLIELGSGSSIKVRILLEAFQDPAAYVAVDVSREHLRRAAVRLASDFPRLEVAAICADYAAAFPLPELGGGGRRLAFFPGSTIGNLEPEAALAFLKLWARRLGPDAAMLVGVDLKKDVGVLHAAYDDGQGVTAAFSLNLLARANRELGADFVLSGFRHEARYDQGLGRIEIHLRSLKDQSVRIAGRSFAFTRGERLHVEHSYKYGIGQFQEMARSAGFEPAAVFTDADELFSVHYLVT